MKESFQVCTQPGPFPLSRVRPCRRPATESWGADASLHSALVFALLVCSVPSLGPQPGSSWVRENEKIPGGPCSILESQDLRVPLVFFCGMFVNQIVMLCTLNLCSAVCQLYLNKTRATKQNKMKLEGHGRGFKWRNQIWHLLEEVSKCLGNARPSHKE